MPRIWLYSSEFPGGKLHEKTSAEVEKMLADGWVENPGEVKVAKEPAAKKPTPPAGAAPDPATPPAQPAANSAKEPGKVAKPRAPRKPKAEKPAKTAAPATDAGNKPADEVKPLKPE